ncbi:hypothetical protein NPIL_97641, partial [Nephila pilipes]
FEPSETSKSPDKIHQELEEWIQHTVSSRISTYFLERRPQLLLLNSELPTLSGSRINASSFSHVQKQPGTGLSPPPCLSTTSSDSQLYILLYQLNICSVTHFIISCMSQVFGQQFYLPISALPLQHRGMPIR